MNFSVMHWGLRFILKCIHRAFCPPRDSLVLTKSGPAEFQFRLAGVQLSDRGFYWCDITAWTKQQPGQAWTKATSAESNKVRIDFQENGRSMCVFSVQLSTQLSVGFTNIIAPRQSWKPVLAVTFPSELFVGGEKQNLVVKKQHPISVPQIVFMRF